MFEVELLCFVLTLLSSLDVGVCFMIVQSAKRGQLEGDARVKSFIESFLVDSRSSCSL